MGTSATEVWLDDLQPQASLVISASSLLASIAKTQQISMAPNETAVVQSESRTVSGGYQVQTSSKTDWLPVASAQIRENSLRL